MGAALTKGELLQLHSGQSMWISEEQYNKIIEQKTACLFAACSEAGAASTGATMRQMTAMRQFGMHLGMCFQLKDDVLGHHQPQIANGVPQNRSQGPQREL